MSKQFIQSIQQIISSFWIEKNMVDIFGSFAFIICF